MIRWFTLTSATTYNWRSKVSGKYYQFIGDNTVAVENPRDQERFSTNHQRFVEVDEKGNILDKDQGGTMTRSAFSRRGMVKQPKSYAKLGKREAPVSVVAPVPEPAKPSAPRTVVSSNKTDSPATDEVKPELEKVPEIDAPSELTPSEDSASKKKSKKSKKSKKASKKAKKSGRTDDK